MSPAKSQSSAQRIVEMEIIGSPKAAQQKKLPERPSMTIEPGEKTEPDERKEQDSSIDRNGQLEPPVGETRNALTQISEQ